jgi:hypothetical protein
MQSTLIIAISGLVALASFCFVWFGAGLVMKLQQAARQPKKTPKAEAAQPEEKA